MRAFIQAVPSRKTNIDTYLLPKVREVTCFESVEVSYDMEYQGVSWGFLNILKKARDSNSDVCIFQDDVVLHSSFAVQAPDLIEHIAMMRVLSLFAPPRGSFLKLPPEVNFVTHKSHLWHQGMMISRLELNDIIAYFESVGLTKQDDEIMGAYLKSRKQSVWVSVPSMVQHNVNMKSAIGNPQTMKGKPRLTPLWRKTVPAGHYKEVNTIQVK